MDGIRDSGLSPRVRGNHRLQDRVRQAAGSIPARAGEPTAPTGSTPTRAVYPRACGGTQSAHVGQGRHGGLSPRVRGTAGTQVAVGQFYGLSPRVRGNLRAAIGSDRSNGSIPAPCGGTRVRKTAARAQNGLSPRVRGNRRRGRDARPREGSIPARAGEPKRAPAPACSGSVYPRACGGTPDTELAAVTNDGLSPRVRGNLQLDLRIRGAGRSIPARAGEPSPCPGGGSPSRVYPRACGGTRRPYQSCGLTIGLSPRVRGNLRQRHGRRGRRRSIPARAGEPEALVSNAILSQVYPRACGGTPPGHDDRRGLGGLSPARAGEPSSPRWSPKPGDGLSPRVRGNPEG